MAAFSGRMSWVGELRFHARKLRLLEAQRSQLRLAVELRQKLPSLERAGDPGMARVQSCQEMCYMLIYAWYMLFESMLAAICGGTSTCRRWARHCLGAKFLRLQPRLAGRSQGRCPNKPSIAKKLYNWHQQINNPTSTNPVIFRTSRSSFCKHKAQTELRKQKRRLQAMFAGHFFCKPSMFLLIQLKVKW